MLAGGVDERSAVPVVGDVARERDDLGELTELARGALELGAAAGVDHERPVALGERAREGEAEASGTSGDDCEWHGRHGRTVAVSVTRGNWS